MKKTNKYLTYFFVFIIILTSIILIINDYEDKKYILQIINMEENEFSIKDLKKEDDLSKITVYYPDAKNQKIDAAIEELIRGITKDFENQINDQTAVDFAKNYNIKFELDVNYSTYSYMGYTSFVFYITSSTVGFHPQINIRTISYDRKDNLIDINYLSKLNPKLLGILSEISRAELKKKLGKNADTFSYLLQQGTSPKAENFSNFAFSKEGLMIFFERYSVGPYCLGEFVITVKYDRLGLSIGD